MPLLCHGITVVLPWLCHRNANININLNITINININTSVVLLRAREGKPKNHMEKEISK